MSGHQVPLETQTLVLEPSWVKLSEICVAWAEGRRHPSQRAFVDCMLHMARFYYRSHRHGPFLLHAARIQWIHCKEEIRIHCTTAQQDPNRRKLEVTEATCQSLHDSPSVRSIAYVNLYTIHHQSGQHVNLYTVDLSSATLDLQQFENSLFSHR